MDNKVLDEAVEVAVAEWFSDTWDYPPDAMRAALLAALPVLLGEPVAWRTKHRDADWSFTTRPHPRDVSAGILQPLYAPDLVGGK